ncbi:glycosyltransferase family 2 protein [Dyadobacter luticola]|uniref:Glycosyltransferase n=1 Tax=Dyadobacter luticola TaxID=1979387 RepID=A0A5R9L565_9BACT|nr:glycosyltransferase [Dyadobacter luticola]TLV03713.1 glycosyltransferase [Dyadobacter luticola]
MTRPTLAIIIPAYKAAFLREAVESIARQTCKDFTLYVGDDASKDDLEAIIEPYKKDINIVFKRFENNVGGKDLVGQWERCLEMLGNEEWIWLFSDDDVMDENCVELFYEHIEKHPRHNLLHFDFQTINEKGENLYKVRPFPKMSSSVELFDNILNHRVFSTVVEYIFRREVFEKVNGFQRFDLAWASDNATWMKIGLYGGIHTIDGALVKWRASGQNISSISDSESIVNRKVNATIAYFNWAKQFFIENQIEDTTTNIEKLKYIMTAVVYTSAINYNQKYQLIMSCLKDLNLENLRVASLALWLSDETKKRIKTLIAYKGY